MHTLDALFLGIIQGITEFIPISSTAHLNLARDLLQIPEPHKVFDVALHGATLIAVLVYFRDDVMQMLMGTLGALWGRVTPPFILAMNIVISTLPVVVLGAIVSLWEVKFPEKSLAINLIIFGIILVGADLTQKGRRKMGMLSYQQAFFIGMFQAIAVAPGVSRLGACLIGCLLVGLTRVEAMKYSFLLSIPTVLGAITLTMTKAYMKDQLYMDSGMLIAMSASLITALITMRGILRWIENNTFRIIGVYRFILGLFLL